MGRHRHSENVFDKFVYLVFVVAGIVLTLFYQHLFPAGLDARQAVIPVSVTSSLSIPQDATPCPNKDMVPQVFNFIKELGCRNDHITVPEFLKSRGEGKVYVVVGLWKGEEFFAAIKGGYSVYGFEMDPVSLKTLRERCSSTPNCTVVEAADITAPLPPYAGGYLICAGAGVERGNLTMFGSGNSGSSFVDEDGREGFLVPVVPVAEVVDADIFYFAVDAQGSESSVLKGAERLFTHRTVKTLQTEVYPKGMSQVDSDFEKFFRYIWDDLGMFCSTTNPFPSGPAGLGAFHYEHPNSFENIAAYMSNWVETPTRSVTLGRFDDILCFNRKKVWVDAPIVFDQPDGWIDTA